LRDNNTSQRFSLKFWKKSETLSEGKKKKKKKERAIAVVVVGVFETTCHSFVGIIVLSLYKMYNSIAQK